MQLSPRKHPKQARSQALVEALLEATARVLETRGYESLTTNRVADVAGVSVGSLYRYFPSKEALVATVLDRYVDRASCLLDATLAGMEQQSALDVTIAVTRGLLELKRERPGLAYQLGVGLPDLHEFQRKGEVAQRARSLLADRLEQEGRSDAAETAATAVLMLEGAMANAASDPRAIASAALERALLSSCQELLASPER